MKQLHPVQMKILRELLFSPSLKFSEIKPLKMEGSQFVFHLDKLINVGYLEKVDSIYTLTPRGREYANKMDEKTKLVIPQAKVSAVQCAVKKEGKKKYYLIYTRLKHPFYGCQGFPTEKVAWGESLHEASQRGLEEETGLRGKAQLFAIRHYRVYLPSQELVEDKIMYAHKIEDPQGVLRANLEGEFDWIREEDLKKKVINPLEEFWEFFQALKENQDIVSFKEIDVITDRF